MRRVRFGGVKVRIRGGWIFKAILGALCGFRLVFVLGRIFIMITARGKGGKDLSCGMVETISELLMKKEGGQCPSSCSFGGNARVFRVHVNCPKQSYLGYAVRNRCTCCIGFCYFLHFGNKSSALFMCRNPQFCQSHVTEAPDFQDTAKNILGFALDNLSSIR